jgi:general L-amino acid transport system permease protein
MGRLMLTLVIATVGIAGALPLGILLALGRRSNMPA